MIKGRRRRRRRRRRRPLRDWSSREESWRPLADWNSSTKKRSCSDADADAEFDSLVSNNDDASSFFFFFFFWFFLLLLMVFTRFRFPFWCCCCCCRWFSISSFPLPILSFLPSFLPNCFARRPFVSLPLKVESELVKVKFKARGCCSAPNLSTGWASAPFLASIS